MKVKPLRKKDFCHAIPGHFCNAYDFEFDCYIEKERLKELFAELLTCAGRVSINEQQWTQTEGKQYIRVSDVEELFGPLVRK